MIHHAGLFAQLPLQFPSLPTRQSYHSHIQPSLIPLPIQFPPDPTATSQTHMPMMMGDTPAMGVSPTKTMKSHLPTTKMTMHGSIIMQWSSRLVLLALCMRKKTFHPLPTLLMKQLHFRMPLGTQRTLCLRSFSLQYHQP